MKTTREVAENFFNVIFNVLASNSSKSYSRLIMDSIKAKLVKDFPFIASVSFTDSAVKVGEEINRAEKKKAGMLFGSVIELLGPDLLKLLIKEQLDIEDLNYLSSLGVKI